MKKIFLAILLTAFYLTSFSQVYYGMLDEDKNNTAELPLQQDNARMSSIEADLGKKLGMVMIFMWYPQTVDVAGCNNLVARGITPILSLEAGMSYTSIISGNYDAYFRTFADALKQINGPVILRYNHEMNGDWYSWSGFKNGANATAAANYGAAWRRVHGIIKTEKQANNVLWNWCVNAGSFPTPNAATGQNLWNDYINYYPGDAYVDWIGFDSYDKPYNYTPTRYKSVDDIFGSIYTILTDAIPDKPILVGEFASENYQRETDPHKADFFSQGGNLFEKYPRIHAFCYFNSIKSNSGRWNNYKYNNPASCTAIFRDNWISPANVVSGNAGIENIHKYKVLPASGSLKIEAENYFDQYGVKNEACTEGGLNVGSADMGNYTDYLIEVTTSGTYPCALRVASAVTTGKIEIKNQAGTVLATHAQTTSTGGNQKYETHTVNVNLTAGKQKLRMYHAGTGLNINWFQLGTTTTSTTTVDNVPSTIYPNPTDGLLTVSTDVKTASKVSISIYNMVGKLVLFNEFPSTNGQFVKILDIKTLPSGTYMLKIKKGDITETKKFIKNKN